MAIDEDLLNIFQARQHAIVQHTNARVLYRHFSFRNSVGLTHAHDLVGRQGAGAHAALMTTTMHLRFNPHAGLAAHKKCPNAFGAISLVRRQTHQVNRQGTHVNVNAAGRLSCIHMKNDAFFTAQSTNGLDVLNHTNFVVHEHHAGQNGVRPNSGLENLQVHQTVCLHFKVSHFKALALQLTAGVQHSFVFGLDRDDVFTLGLVKTRCALQSQIVRLGGA